MARGRPSKKAHIIDAACGLFSKQGYQSTSIDQVVLAAEVSKPTVYSNFPTKLVLWETVLESLIERAKEDMNACLHRLQEDMNACLHRLQEVNDSSFTKGWVSLWQVWIEKPERLAVYRVLLGEQHKLEASTLALFDQFETVLESILKQWIEACHVSQVSLFLLKAISKEALLMPVLLNQNSMSSEQLTLLVEKVIATKE